MQHKLDAQQTEQGTACVEKFKQQAPGFLNPVIQVLTSERAAYQQVPAAVPVGPRKCAANMLGPKPWANQQ